MYFRHIIHPITLNNEVNRILKVFFWNKLVSQRVIFEPTKRLLTEIRKLKKN
jgi:hypothetical protein